MKTPSRRKVALVLAAGALASVATSVAIAEWTLSREVPLEITLGNTRPTRMYAIAAELNGPFQLDGLFGSTEIQVDVSTAPTGTATAAVVLVLRAGGVELDRETVGLAANSRTTVFLVAGAFAACRDGDRVVPPCVDAWELDLEWLPVIDAPDVTLTGTVTVRANGRDEDEDMLPPPGTTMAVTVTDLGTPQ
jgi:hypothetical protein